MIDKFLLDGFLDDITWSYSNIKSFKTCKRLWYRRYILGENGLGSFYSDYGLLVHKMLEEYANNKLPILDFKKFVEYNWDKYIVNESPINKNGEELAELYYNQLMFFIEMFDGFKDKTIGVELEVNTELNNKKFLGYIDRLSIDKDGEYIVTDYKSKSKFNSKKELAEYSKQLYLYSKYIYEIYGKYPKKLRFYLFRTCEEVEVEFNKKEYDRTIEEIGDCIDEIYKETEFPCSYQYFFCNNLCEFRDTCIFE